MKRLKMYTIINEKLTRTVLWIFNQREYRSRGHVIEIRTGLFDDL